jgi:hypothetical protein
VQQIQRLQRKTKSSPRRGGSTSKHVHV